MNNDLSLSEVLKEEYIQYLSKGKVLDWGQFYDLIIRYELDNDCINLLKRWHQSIGSLSFLKDLPSTLEEVFIHSAQTIEYKNMGTLTAIDHDLTNRDIELILDILALNQNKEWNYKIPFISFHYKLFGASYRISLLHKSITPEKAPKAFIRKLNIKPLSLSAFNYYNQDRIERMVLDSKNILIAGSTGSGKTSLLNTLLQSIDKNEHTIILEDTYELYSPNDKTTRLISSEKYQQTLSDLLTYSLRMTPDRIILGEMRSKEVSSFLLAMNTGHRGLISSLHANSAEDALHRTAMMFMMYSNINLSYELVLKLICQNIDYVIYLEDKNITSIIEVFGSEQSNIFFDKVS